MVCGEDINNNRQYKPRNMLPKRRVNKYKLKQALSGKKKALDDVAPVCPKHQCDITDFQCGSWNVVACRGCVNLESMGPVKRRNLIRNEAVSRSSDLIFKLLAEGSNESTFTKLRDCGKARSTNVSESSHRMSTPSWLNKSDAKQSDTKTRQLLEEFSHLVQSKETKSDSTTFVHCKDSDEEAEISVHGLLGQVLQDLCDMKCDDGRGCRQSRPISVSDYLDFVKKACEEDSSIGTVKGKDTPADIKSETTKRKTSQSTGAVPSKTVRGVQKARQSFTALVHLSDSPEEEQLLSVHGLLGRMLHDLCEKKNDITSRYSRPISIAEYITLVKKACEEDSSLGEIECNVKEQWNLQTTFRLTPRVENITAIAGNPNGDFAIADRVSKQVIVLDSKGNFKFTLDNPDVRNILCAPRGIATNSSGEYFVVDGTKTVKVYDNMGSLKRMFETKAENAHPTCIAVGNQDRVLIGDKRASVLTLHTAEGDLLRRVNIAAKPNFISLNTNNDIFISDINTGKVHAVDYQGQPIFTMDTVIEGTRYKTIGLCCDLADDIYVTLQSDDSLNNPVCRFSPQGKLLGCVSRDLCNPQGLCFTATDKLLVADDHTVKQYIM